MGLLQPIENYQGEINQFMSVFPSAHQKSRPDFFRAAWCLIENGSDYS